MSSTGYTYYDGSAYVPGTRQASRQRALALSRSRAIPSPADPDYLVLEARHRWLDLWLQELPEADVALLDVGGRIQPYRDRLGARCSLYVAIDPQLEGLTDVVGFGEALPFAGASFDAVLCTQVLSYARAPTLAVAEIERVLKPGGRLFLTAPALFPEHHDEHWRFLPSGYRQLLAGWDEVRILPEGDSFTGAVRTVNVLLAETRRRWLAATARRWLIPGLNRLARRSVSSDPERARSGALVANYSVLARKPHREVRTPASRSPMSTDRALVDGVREVARPGRIQ